MTPHSRKARKRRTLTAKERALIRTALYNAEYDRAASHKLASDLCDAIIIIEVPQHTERVSQ